jgi:hypothetical protein
MGQLEEPTRKRKSDWPIVVKNSGNAGGAKGLGHSVDRHNNNLKKKK